MRIILIISLTTLLISCLNSPSDSVLESDGKLANNGAFFILPVSESEFDSWNKGSVAGWAELMQAASKEFYKLMSDEFDFLFFVVDNEDLPYGAPYGAQLQTSNSVDGLGLYNMDSENRKYGSDGKLQSVITLWKTNIDEGPILHEMGHRWFNLALETDNPSHWSKAGSLTSGTNPGIFEKDSNNFADVELYLMGLIPASEVTDHKDTLDEIVAKHGSRYPTYDEAQTDFRGAIILITQKTFFNTEEMDNLKKKIERIESDTPQAQGINWARQTGGRGNLDLSGLDAFKK